MPDQYAPLTQTPATGREPDMQQDTRPNVCPADTKKEGQRHEATGPQPRSCGAQFPIVSAEAHHYRVIPAPAGL